MPKAPVVVLFFCVVFASQTYAGEKASASEHQTLSDAQQQNLADYFAYMAKHYPHMMPAVVAAAKRNACPVPKQPATSLAPPMC